MIHSLAIVYVVKIAFVYFAEKKANGYHYEYSSRGQMIAFILLGNREDRGYWSTMYNDEIMMLYMLVAIYYMIKNRPMLGSFWVTMALGVKAGVILLLPGLLGQIQYNHGTIKLLICFTIIIGF